MGESGAAPPRILAVDDEEPILTVISEILRADGCVVLAAKSGREALVIAARDQPDVILLDAQMPEMDGFDTARSLTATERTNGIPIVMVTALTGPENRLRALRAGA
ncbi:MAG: response regulator, partial [Spirochaetia bacterium]